MHAAEDERRTKAASPRRRHVDRHLRGGERLQAAPQSLQLGIVDPDPGATGIHQSAVRCVIRQQERPEPREPSRSPGRDRGPAHPESGAFLSGPAEPEGVSNQRACDRTLIHISPRSRVRSGAGWAEFGGIRDPAELSTTDPPNRCHLPVWHWRVEPLDIDDAFRGGNGIGDEYYLIADFEKLL